MTEPTFFAAPEELRAWLEAHHDTAAELLLGIHKKASGRPSITQSQAVDEALCFGWIDGRVRRIDDDAYCVRLTPRKPRSHWSNVNVAKVAALTAEGRMRPSGLAAFATRTEDNTGQASFERTEPARFTPEQEARFKANAEAWAWFAAQAPSYQRTATHVVVSAKRPETRERRLDELIACSAQGRRIPRLTPRGR